MFEISCFFPLIKSKWELRSNKLVVSWNVFQFAKPLNALYHVMILNNISYNAAEYTFTTFSRLFSHNFMKLYAVKWHALKTHLSTAPLALYTWHWQASIFHICQYLQPLKLAVIVIIIFIFVYIATSNIFVIYIAMK